MEQISGVPIGYKLVAIDVPSSGEYYMTMSGKVSLHGKGLSTCVCPILLKEHFYDQLSLEDVPIPDGYMLDGANVKQAYREPKRGELSILNELTYIWNEDAERGVKRLIVKPIKRKVRYAIIESPLETGPNDFHPNQRLVTSVNDAGNVLSFIYDNVPAGKLNVRFEEREV